MLRFCSHSLSSEDLKSVKAGISLLSCLAALDAVADSVHMSRILQDCLTFEVSHVSRVYLTMCMSYKYRCVTEHDITSSLNNVRSLSLLLALICY